MTKFVLVQAQQTTELSDVSEQQRTKQVRMAVTKRIKELGRAKKVQHAHAPCITLYGADGPHDPRMLCIGMQLNAKLV